MQSSSIEGYVLVSSHDFAEVKNKLSNAQNALFSLRHYRAGQQICGFSAGTISAEPTYLTVQVAEGKHITLQPEFLQYVNHSCDPNVFFDTTAMILIALKEINPGEEMVFFYPSTEWKMTQHFKCYCGNPCCLGEIKGASYLTKQVLKNYRVTDFIQQEMAKRTRKVA